MLLATPPTACRAQEEQIEEPHREGLNIPLAGLTFNLFITRQLNLRDPEDKDYFAGPEAPPGRTYYGVFLRVCNEESVPAQAAQSFRIRDTQGGEYEPIELPSTNVFAYRPRQVAPEECIPKAGSLASFGPTGGAMLLFELPLTAGENRPLILEITGPGRDEHGEPQVAEIELDI